MARNGADAERMTRAAMTAEYLDAETELRLAYAWRDQRDEAALHRLTSAYLRLAVSMASKFRRHGAPMNDLIQEASLGLMKAADKFDPDRGVRFSTYAIWWIRASIQDYVMRNWSMVRTGSTTSQKALFFNFKRVASRLERRAAARGQDLDPHQLRELVAGEIGVSVQDVAMMQGRLSGGDLSLNTRQAGDDGGREWIETVVDEAEQGAEHVTRRHDRARVREWLIEALAALDARERFILRERRLRGDTRTLESLGAELNLSKERVRQIEAAAFGKMRRFLEARDLGVAELIA